MALRAGYKHLVTTVYIMCCSYDQLLADKEAVEQEYILYRKEVKHTKAGASTKVKA